MTESISSDPHHEDETVTNGVINGGFIEVLTPSPSQEILQWNKLLSAWQTTEANNEAKIKKKPKPALKSSKPCFNGEFLLNWATKVDEICRLAFPLTFFLLVIAYCTVFVILQWVTSVDVKPKPKKSGDKRSIRVNRYKQQTEQTNWCKSFPVRKNADEQVAIKFYPNWLRNRGKTCNQS